ncbi:MAG TPA: serine/threonine-protein kinase, partial [Polyangiaceae bacterium]|nr:serine/threonine-protein kinase [Polyangiaceae bacterium]
MATVYAAEDPHGRVVAIKFMLESFREDPDACRLFSREAQIANEVGHPWAVPVLDYDIDEDGCAFLIMPLLEGETVRARWERAQRRLPVAEVAVLMSDVLDVLTSAHAKGIVHSDIKPENLFVTVDGNVRVLDFGIARRFEPELRGLPRPTFNPANATGATMTGRMIGSPAFMPPEQALGNRPAIGPHSDCWAAGATIFALLSGELVHPADSAPAQLVAAATKRARSLAAAAPNLPEAIVRFVDKALIFEPEERWPSAREMSGALLDAFEGALGESVASVASRVRPNLMAELSGRVEDTMMSARGEREAGGGRILGVESRSPRAASLRRDGVEDSFESMAREYIARFQTYQGIEFQIPQEGLLFAFQSLPAVAQRIMAKYGLGQFNEEGWFVPNMNWWPMDVRLAYYHHGTAVVGTARQSEITALFAKNQELFFPTDNIH